MVLAKIAINMNIPVLYRVWQHIMDWCVQYIQCVFPVQGGTRYTSAFIGVILSEC